MKKILFLFIAILFSLNVGATTYYIDPSGVDDAGRDGSISQPWQKLSYATSRVAEGDHTIYVNAGTYPVDSDQAYIRVGVKIDGAGATSYLKTDYNPGGSYSGWIHFYSATLTNGNQSVKNVRIGGENLAGNCAINIINRSNIEIYNVEIFDFAARGINIRHDGGAVTYITGIEIHECNIHNCSDRTVTTSCGLIVNKGADGTDIHDNTLTQTGRAEGHNGNIYTSWGGYEKNTKFYRNVCTKPDHEGVQVGDAGWNFHWESGACYGGIEIYENTFVGGVAVDIAGGETGNHYAGASTYSYYIHHNTHSLTTQLTYSAGIQRAIFVDLEGLSEDVIVEYNYIDKVTELIACNTTRAGSYITRFKFRYNIGTNLGYTPSVTSPWRCGVQLSASNSTGYVTNCEIDNNIIIGNGIIAGVGLSASTGATIENIKIRNNIVQGVVSWGWLVFRNTGGAYEDIYPWNNIIYDCVTDDTPYYEGGVSVTNYDPQNNIVSNPLFVGTGTPPLNYKLQSTSPGRDAGYAVGLISDYGGYSVPVGSAPDIGAWEYGADVDPPNWTEQGIGWDRMQKKVNFRDTVNFTRGFMIAGVPISSSGSGLEILGGLTATVNDLNNTSGSTGNLQGQINAIKASTVDDSKADTSLSNLASVAINTHLLPASSGSANLGSALLPFGSVYANGTVSLPSTTSIGSVSSTEIGYVNNVTSAIQTQFNATKTRIDSIVTVLADTANIETLLQIDFDTDTLADLSEVRLKLNIADSLTKYVTPSQLSDSIDAAVGVIISDVRDEIADSLNVLRPTVRLLADTIPIFVFGAGGANDGDTVVFTTSTIYGSFFNIGSDTLVITQLKCIMLGEAGDTLGVDINWSDTLQAVVPTELNTTPHPFGYTSSGKVGSTDTSFNNTKIPPNKWIWCDTPFISAGHKPKYFNAQISGYKIPKY